MKPTKRQESIILGTILGDAYVQPTGKTNARLRLEHSTKQEDFLLWKMDELKGLTEGTLTYMDRVHPKTKKTYHYVRYQSYTCQAYGDYRRLFYPDGKKKIPENLETLLDPTSLAVWYMDDGFFSTRDNGSYLYLGRVEQLEAEIAQDAIKSKIGVSPAILDKKKKGFVLYWSPKKTKTFAEIIKEDIIPYFSYKLPFDPVMTEGFNPEIDGSYEDLRLLEAIYS